MQTEHAHARRWPPLIAALATLAIGLAQPVLGAEPGPTVAFLGIHASPDVGQERALEVARWVALSLEDASNVQFRDLDSVGAGVSARREDVLNEAFLGAARFELIGAQKLFDAAQIEEAEGALDRALQIMDRGGEYLRDAQLAVDIYLYKGLCASWTGNAAGAVSWFALAAAMDPERSLDPVRFPEDVISQFTEARDKVKRAAPGVLRIGTGAAGSQILLDGRPVGTAPANLEARPGKHYLSVLSDRLGRAYAVFEVASGRSVEPALRFGDTGLAPLDDPEAVEGKQSKRVQGLYERLAKATGTDVLFLAAFDDAGAFRVQAFSRRDGRFSRPQVADALLSQKAPDDVVGRMVARLASAIRPDGTLSDDMIGTSTAPMFLGRNAVLNGLLLGPGWARPLGSGHPEAQGPVVTSTPVTRRPWFWAILGGAAAAAAAGVAVGVTVGSQSATGTPSDTGTITISFGGG